jgi:hypothetical protein
VSGHGPRLDVAPGQLAAAGPHAHDEQLAGAALRAHQGAAAGPGAQAMRALIAETA